MRSQRSHNPVKRPIGLRRESSLFSILPIIKNMLAIAVLVGAYYYVFVRQNMYPELDIYAYWTVKILVGYNIIVASARSLIAPLLTLITAAAALYANAATAVPYVLSLISLSNADAWQLAAAGAVGFVITLAVKL